MTAAPAQLGQIREAIERTDREIVDRLEARAELSRQAARLLREWPGGSEVSDVQALDRIEALGHGVLEPESLRRVYAEVLAVARGLEEPARIAYVGPEGGFGELMARSYFGEAATLIESPTVALALEEVVRGRATFCTFAVESSVDGLLLPAISALADTELVIVAERSMPAVLSLMRLDGAEGPLERLHATAAVHAECRLYVERALGSPAVVDARSSVEAAERARQDASSAALVPEACGRRARLRVVEENVRDVADLHYRHAVVGARPASRSGTDTTCLLFSLEDAPGTLYQVLRHFAERGLNLAKIQSRPVRASAWDYLFYVEIAGHITDRAVLAAVEAVRGSTRYFKVLGSFPSARQRARALP